MTLDFALMRLAGMMEKLLVYPERMLANLESLGGVVHSGEVLLALTKAGILREDAYRIVQSCAMATWTLLGTPEGRSFRENLDGRPGGGGHVSSRRSWTRRWTRRCICGRWTGSSSACSGRRLS